MYHAYPDKMHLQMISAEIYDRVKDRDFHAAPLEINSLSNISSQQMNQPCYGRNCPPPRPCYGRDCRPPRRNYHDDGRPDWLKHLIDTLLYEEVNHRRRRYRSRRPW